MSKLAIAVHGGAGTFPRDTIPGAKEEIALATERGWKILRDGGSALEAAIATVLTLEDSGAFDAGAGSHLTQEGTVEMDASVMEGRHLNVGAVCSVKRVANPILIAKELLYEPEILLSGEGAERFAAARGLSFCDPASLIHPREQALYEAQKADTEAITDGSGERIIPHGPLASFRADHTVCRVNTVSISEPNDTVGAVCLDKDGWIVVATSTGGKKFKPPGRVGDSPLVGCGFYAQDGVGGAGCTGLGEQISRVVLSKYAVEQMERGKSSEEAAEAALRELRRKLGAEAGIICVDAAGHPSAAHTTLHMAYGLMRADAKEIVVGID
jgi:beta-aspartyl-peptidase (threonine type)